MIENTIDPVLIDGFKKAVENCKKAVVTCHISPDGDAIGSNLALALLLQNLGKKATVITPDDAPEDMAFLSGYDSIISYKQRPEDADRIINEADTIFCLDFNGIKRVGAMGDTLRNAKAYKVMVDHHLYPEDFCNIVISMPEMTSTCELLYRIIMQSGHSELITLPVAEGIYTGMMTDTGNFSYNSNKASLYTIVADLVGRGVNKDRIHKLTIGTSPENRLRLNGYALAEKMTLYPEHKASLIILTKEDLDRFNYQVGDTEALANMPLAIPTVIWSTFMRQEKNYVKISMRSEGDFAVNTLCTKYFNGGGHANAAGGEFKGTMEEAIKTYFQIFEDFKQQ